VIRVRKLSIIACALIIILASCNGGPIGKPSFVYVNSTDDGRYEVVEYYLNESVKQYVNNFVYDSVTKKLKELTDYVSNAIKKINGEVWFAFDNGFGENGYSSSLCKITEAITVDCLYEIKNQQVDDFYIDFENQVFYGAGPGVGKEPEDKNTQTKVVKYNMQTGEETIVKNNGKHIEALRLTNICPGQFITDDGDIHRETGEKIGEIVDKNGEKLIAQINDLKMQTTIFVGSDRKSLEVYGCEDNQTKHMKTIELSYEPDIYPTYHSWETADNGEITMPIRSEDDIFEYIGFQSVNTRTGEVEVHLFDEPVSQLHSIARFV